MNDPGDELRLSDAERAQALDALSGHYVEGRLDLTEFDERTTTVTAARTIGELAPSFEGLPGGVPFAVGADGRPQFRGDVPAGPRSAPGVEVERAERELRSLKRRGDLVERITEVGGALALVSFFVLMFLGVPYFWAVWPVFGLLAIGARAVVGLSGTEEKAYAQIKEAEADERSERLKIALQRRRELEGPGER